MAEILKNAAKGNKAFWICLGVSIFLIIGGCLTPPPFVIDSSIFIACGILFGFAALYVLDKAIDTGRTATIKHGDTELTVGDKD